MKNNAIKSLTLASKAQYLLSAGLRIAVCSAILILPQVGNADACGDYNNCVTGCNSQYDWQPAFQTDWMSCCAFCNRSVAACIDGQKKTALAGCKSTYDTCLSGVQAGANEKTGKATCKTSYDQCNSGAKSASYSPGPSCDPGVY